MTTALYDPAQFATQTRSGFPAGNCTEASIASVLGCAIEAVPQLWCGRAVGVETNDDAHPPERVSALHNWLKVDRRLMWVELAFDARNPPAIEPAELRRAPRWLTWDLHMMAGYNGDDVGHMVVGSRGHVVWDPNPDRKGIHSLDLLVWLVPMSQIPWQWRHHPGFALNTEALCG